MTRAQTSGPNRAMTLRDYLEIARRRKWLLITVPLAAAVAAFAFSKTQDAVYQAQASVLVNRSVGVSTGIIGIDPSTTDATRYLATQASIARSPALAARVAAVDEVSGLGAADVLASSSVVPRQDADVLDFFVTHGDAKDAEKVANAYSREFTKYKTELDTSRIREALSVVGTRLASLQARGQGDSATAQTLAQYESQLLAAAELVAESTAVLEPAVGGAQISPNPKRNVILASMLGLVLALGLAFVAEALDRRARTEDEIAEALGLPLLGRLATPSRDLRSDRRLVMLAAPTTVQAEAFRKLRANIEAGNREYGTRTLMFTSASQGEGKTTTVANVAVAFAQAGRRIVLVDLDIRKPSLHTFLDAQSDRGIADAVREDRPIEEVIQHLWLSHPRAASGDGHLAMAESRWGSAGAPSGASPKRGSERTPPRHALDFIACGYRPSYDEAFLGSERLSAALAALGNAYDIVLLDVPPFPAVGDTMALGEKVDGIVVVSRLGTHRRALRELARELQHSQARTLGFIVTGVSQGDRHSYGHGYGYGPPEADRPAIGPPRAVRASGSRWAHEG